jgi:ADP-ribose pyrophosphatase YjhB (NUDIX family)
MPSHFTFSELLDGCSSILSTHPNVKHFAMRILNHKYVVGVLAFIQNKDNQILLFNHRIRHIRPWGLPGGAAKKQDISLQEALKRELREEADLEVTVGDLLTVTQDERNQGALDFIFQCSIGSQIPDVSQSWEIRQAAYFELANIPEVALRHAIAIQSISLSRSIGVVGVPSPKNNPGA